MADDKIIESGIWLTDDGKVVKKQPKGGSTQLVRPGGKVSSAVQARIDSLDADPDAKPISAAVALGYETASAPEAEKAADTAKAVDKPAPRKSSK